MNVLSSTRCALGEGALWHPSRKSLFWFDIIGRKLYEHAQGQQQSWSFDHMVSAAGWIDNDRLIVASEVALSVFDLGSGAQRHLSDLEVENPVTRSNDGRADPYGGFWIGTMGKSAEPAAGAIYRYYKGTLRRLFADITISNAICFAPDGEAAYFTDTATGIVQRVALDDDGWPAGAPDAWLDLHAEGLNPDGAVVDAEGRFWNAQWGSGRVACYSPDGALHRVVELPASQVTCPSFGGDDLSTLFVTSAAHGAADEPEAGCTFEVPLDVAGLPEPRVIV